MRIDIMKEVLECVIAETREGNTETEVMIDDFIPTEKEIREVIRYLHAFGFVARPAMCSEEGHECLFVAWDLMGL